MLKTVQVSGTVYVNHAINFYLYCITGSLFRQELCALFGCRPPPPPRHGSRLTRPASRRGMGTAAAGRLGQRHAQDLELENFTN